MGPVSVVIIASNAELTIDATLHSLRPFPDVLLYLNDSTDGTRGIAAGHPNVTVADGPFAGFGPTRNHAADRARHDWVLSIDSDETIPPALAAEIGALALDDVNAVYALKRDNYFLGKHVRHGGWGRDTLVRLYNRTRHRFNDALVHERVEPRAGAPVTLLVHSFRHHAVRNLDQLLLKIIQYSELAAADKTTRSFLVVLGAAHFAFFRSYVLQLGFLEGWRGVVIAVSNFNGRFFRYTKRYLNCGRK